MNLLDMLIIAALLFLCIRGLYRGFFREIGSLAGVILGIWIANLWQPALTEWIKGYFEGWHILPLISFGAIFLGVVILSNLVAWTLWSLSRRVLLGWLDRGAGLALAVAKTLVITYLAIVILTFFVPSQQPLITESRLAPWVVRGYQSLAGFISPDLYKDWKKKFLDRPAPPAPGTGPKGSSLD